MKDRSLRVSLCLLVCAQFVHATSIVDGYMNTLSAYPGDTVSLYLNATAKDERYKLKLYDLSGNVVHQATVSVFPQKTSSEKPYEAGFGYFRSCKTVLPNLPSGLYLWEDKIPLVVKAHRAKIIVIYPSNTETAYNNGGGKSLYPHNSTDSKGSAIVSFRRPAGIEVFSEAFLRWLHTEGIPSVGYITDMDMDDYNAIAKADLIIIPGHSEYWTLKARKNFDRFVKSGKNALVLSGNTMWWQVRYSERRDQLICYRKAENDNYPMTEQKTISWCDPSLGYPILKSLGADYNDGGYGDKTDRGWDGYKIIRDSPLLAGTGLKSGDMLALTTREADGAPLAGFKDGKPILDNSKLGFYRAEIIGYDYVFHQGKDGVQTWLVFQSTQSSGVVINVASTNWCSNNGIGSNPQIKIITRNMIEQLMYKANVFSAPGA